MIKNWKKFNEGSEDDYKSHYIKFMNWLFEKNFELYDGGEDLKSYFFTTTNEDISPTQKAGKITSYLDKKWGLYDGYDEVQEYLSNLFMN